MISVVVPNYNQKQFVAQAIQSLLAQTLPADEIIVIDDGSTDGSHEVIESFGDRLRYIYQDNKGLGGARNTGILAAKGDLIGLLDADDVWTPNYLEKMAELIQRYPTAAVYYCNARGINQTNNELPQIFGGRVVSTKYFYHNLLRANFIIPSTVLLRKSVVSELGMFEQNNRIIHGCEDWDLWIRLLKNHHGIVGTDECLVYYRVHSSSLSANPKRMQQAAQAVVQKNFGEDDGQMGSWSQEKRLAYGGMYRYHVLTTIQRQGDWQAGAEYLERALIIDPTLSLDVDLFYDLALGSQPPGYRGTAQYLSLEANESNIRGLLQDVFSSPTAHMFSRIRKQTYGTAYYALGLLAYNSKEKSLSRTYLSRAIKYRPDLWRNSLVISDIFKSFLPRGLVDTAKSIIGRS